MSNSAVAGSLATVIEMTPAATTAEAVVTKIDVEPAAPPPPRIASIDAFRGLAMLLMASEGLGIITAAKSLPESSVWQILSYHVSHVEWIGCSLWDLIQPSFTFLVGVSLPYSIASRAAKGQSRTEMLRHAIIRSLALVLLGVFLRSDGRAQTYYTFEDTLTQIGLGYTFCFLLAFSTPRIQILSALGILALYWLAFAMYPLPPAGFDYSAVGVPADWHRLNGLAAHWDKNTNLAAGFDQWFLNLFPREEPFVFNRGGYLTLNFIPTLSTMIFGLLAGGVIKGPLAPNQKLRALIVAGITGIALGHALGVLGICPIVKRIWTPSWTLFSGGWCFLLMTGFYWCLDIKGRKGWAFPLVIVGMNSIAMYVIAHLFPPLIDRTLKTHLGQNFFEHAGIYAPIAESAALLIVMWLMVYWMYRRRLFLRI